MFNVNLSKNETIEESIKDFSQTIMKLSRKYRQSHIDTIVDYCEHKGMEIESASRLISPKLRDIIYDEANRLNCLDGKTMVLPI